FDFNGSNPSGTPLYNGAHITTTPNDTTDDETIHVYLYNNIFQNQKADGGNNNTAIILNKYYDGTLNDYTLESDYNSYRQTGANTVFCVWSAYVGPNSDSYSFGANGPGHASGDWYNEYGFDTTVPGAGTGHFHSDVNSKG